LRGIGCALSSIRYGGAIGASDPEQGRGDEAGDGTQGGGKSLSCHSRCGEEGMGGEQGEQNALPGSEDQAAHSEKSGDRFSEQKADPEEVAKETLKNTLVNNAITDVNRRLAEKLGREVPMFGFIASSEKKDEKKDVKKEPAKDVKKDAEKKDAEKKEAEKKPAH
jgi:hypothetical protein